MTLNGHASNAFWNQRRVTNQVGHQQIYGHLNIYPSQSNEDSHLLNLLPNVAQAAFNAYDRRHDPICLPGTRVDVLKQIEAWADESDDQCIFWLNGMAGMGKSTIARTVARQYHERDRLGASFFFSRDQQDLRDASRLFPSIATQLAKQSIVLKEHICEAVARHQDIAQQTLHDQWTQLIFHPIRKLQATPSEVAWMIVIDALDECEDENDIIGVIQLLAAAKELGKGRLRIFMTSRPETPIRLGFVEIPNNQHQDFALHNVSSFVINRDISIFFQHELNAFGSSVQWLSKSDTTRLVERGGGLFIWAATACRFIKGGRRIARQRLTLILNEASGNTELEKLDAIYTTILLQSINGDYTDQEKEELLKSFREIVGSIVILFDPLPALALAQLLNRPKEEIYQALSDLYSVLEVPNSPRKPIRLIHPSFHKFLLSRERCSNPQFCVNEREGHHQLFVSCVELMSKALKQDLCSLGRPGTRADEVEKNQREECLPRDLQYACRYWVEHLQRCEIGAEDSSLVHSFLGKHLLHWLETLGWMNAASEGILILTVYSR